MRLEQLSAHLGCASLNTGRAFMMLLLQEKCAKLRIELRIEKMEQVRKILYVEYA
jgi:hypothetical protein